MPAYLTDETEEETATRTAFCDSLEICDELVGKVEPMALSLSLTSFGVMLILLTTFSKLLGVLGY